MPRLTSAREPSWAWQAAGEALVTQVLRPRIRLGPPAIRPAESELVHRSCLVLGHAANDAQRHLLAQACFESAFNAKDDYSALISAINMRLKLGQCTLAAALYKRLLDEGLLPTEPQRELVRRKLVQAEEAIETRSRAAPSGSATSLQDEVAELVAPLPRGAWAPRSSELDEMVKLLRRQGHASNELGDVHAALHAFDACFCVSRAPADLLSAANMRVKLVETSCAAEALYDYLLSLGEELGVHEATVATRKLEFIRQKRRERAVALALPPSRPALGGGRREEATAAEEAADAEFMAWLNKTALRSPGGSLAGAAG